MAGDAYGFISRLVDRPGLMALPAVVYGVLNAAIVWFCSRPSAGYDETHDELVAVLETSAVGVKALAVLTVPVLIRGLHRSLSDRRRPEVTVSIWAVTWIAVGWGLLAVGVALSDLIRRGTNGATIYRLRPADAESDGYGRQVLDGIGAGDRYTTAWVIGTETVFMVIVALAVSLVLHRVAVSGVAMIVVPLTVVALLGVYNLAAPVGFVLDYDFFFGDVILGGVLAELVFGPFPVDPTGAVAIGVAALVMAVQASLRPSPNAEVASEVAVPVKTGDR